MKCTDRYVWLLLLLLPRASVGRGEEEEREKRSVRSETCPHLDVYHRGRENMNHHLLAFLDLSLNDLYIKQNKKQKRALLSALSHTRGPRQHSLSHSSVHFLFYTLISLVVRIVFLLLLLLLLADALAVTRQPTESIKNVMDRTPLLGARQGPDQTHTHTWSIAATITQGHTRIITAATTTARQWKFFYL